MFNLTKRYKMAKKKELDSKELISTNDLTERLDSLSRLITNFAYFKNKAGKAPDKHAETYEQFKGK